MKKRWIFLIVLLILGGIGEDIDKRESNRVNMPEKIIIDTAVVATGSLNNNNNNNKETEYNIKETKTYNKLSDLKNDVTSIKDMVFNTRKYDRNNLNRYSIETLFYELNEHEYNFNKKYNLNMMIITGTVDNIDKYGNISLSKKTKDKLFYDEMICTPVDSSVKKHVSTINKGDLIEITGELSLNVFGNLKFKMYEIK